MPRSDADRRATGERTRAAPSSNRRDTYAALATRPFHTLLFMLPLVGAYELGSWLYLTSPEGELIETIRAHSIILGFFQGFDLAARFLPALLVLAYLVTWQVLSRDPLRVRPGVLAGMVVEVIAWTLPLLVLAAVVQGMTRPPVPAAGHAGGALAGADLSGLGWPALVTISIGAGIYEELLFRALLMAGVHFVFRDLFRTSERMAQGLAVVCSALAFAWYHDASLWNGGVGQGSGPGPFLYFAAAGAYFALVYRVRGYAVVAGIHALFDVIVLVLMADS